MAESDWTLVKDGAPEIGVQVVLALTDNYGQRTYRVGCRWGVDEPFYLCYGPSHLAEVGSGGEVNPSHWMPILEPCA